MRMTFNKTTLFQNCQAFKLRPEVLCEVKLVVVACLHGVALKVV